MKPVVTEPQGRLLRALTRVLTPLATPSDRQFPSIIVVSWEANDWSSLTFAGQRHRIALTLPQSGAPIPSLDQLEIAGQIVAEARIVATAETPTGGVALDITVMTVEAR